MAQRGPREARGLTDVGSRHRRASYAPEVGSSRVRAHRECQLGSMGVRARFPLWGMDTARLAREFVIDGFRAVVVCVDPRLLDAAFVGREFDHELLDDLPSSVDACGENGEFHTFVYDAPIFTQPVKCSRGEVVERHGFVFCDLLHSG